MLLSTMSKLKVVVFLFLALISPSIVVAQEAIEAKIVKIIEEKQIEVMDSKQLYQKLELEISNRDHQKIIIENGDQPLANIIKYSLGDKVIVSQIGNDSSYVITDFVRTDGLLLLSIIFIILIVVVAKWRGLFSMLGMVFTFLVIFLFILPRIIAGDNPIFISIIASIVIIPVSYYLAHGLNKKTTIAIIGSIITLIITSILASVFINLGHLTGFSSEEAGMFSLDHQGLNMQSVILAGIIIGALGVLDDITISQAAIVDELALTAKLTKTTDLYSRAMVIGKDHITSMVNTLVLAYAGVSMPLLLIFVSNPHPISEIINYEMIAEEIIRTLVGSIGLVLAVPITTFIAAKCYKK